MSGLQIVHQALVSAKSIAPPAPREVMIIMDHHPLFRAAVRRLVSGSRANLDLHEAASFEDMTAFLASHPRTDYILYDLAADQICDFAGLLYLRAECPEIPVLVLSASEDPAVIRRCMALGATGVVLKTLTADQLSRAVEALVDGESWLPDGIDVTPQADRSSDPLRARFGRLTRQEVRVLSLLCEGLFNREIADKLQIAEATVKAHVSKILSKLGVYSRTQAVIAVTKIDRA